MITIGLLYPGAMGSSIGAALVGAGHARGRPFDRYEREGPRRGGAGAREAG